MQTEQPISDIQPIPGVRIRAFGKPTDWRGTPKSREFILAKHLSPQTLNVYNPHLGKTRRLLTAESGWNVEMVGEIGFAHSVSGDAVSIVKGEAVIMKPADCPILVIRSGDTVTVVHCGRDNLIDRNALLERKKSTSIIDSVWNSLNGASAAAWVGFGIDPANFPHDPNHPDHGTYNRAMIGYLKKNHPHAIDDQDTGKIDLHTLVASQLLRKKPASKRIAGSRLCPFDHNDQLWSHRRSNEERNLVLVEFFD